MIVFALIFVIKGWKLVENNLDIETVTLFFDFWLVHDHPGYRHWPSSCDGIWTSSNVSRGHAADKEIVL